MKTLLALLLLIPSLSWGEKFYLSCKSNKLEDFENGKTEYFDPTYQINELFYVDMNRKVIGKQRSMGGFHLYEFTNEKEEFVCGLYTLPDASQYICVNRYTLDLSARTSNNIKELKRRSYSCENIEQKF